MSYITAMISLMKSKNMRQHTQKMKEKLQEKGSSRIFVGFKVSLKPLGRLARLSIKAPERTQDTLRKVGSIDRPYKIQASARHRAVPMLVCLPFFRARSTLVRLSPEENGIGHPFSPVCQLAENTFSTSCQAFLKACRFQRRRSFCAA